MILSCYHKIKVIFVISIERELLYYQKEPILFNNILTFHCRHARM